VTRLAQLDRRAALALVGVLLLLIGYGLAGPSAPAPHPSHGPAHGDAALYRAIDARMTAGEGYYRAAAEEQRLRRYPLRPFVTVRLPTLSWLAAAAGPAGALLLLRLLVVATIAATIVRIRQAVAAPPLRVAACVLAAACAVPFAQPVLALWHEMWAGLLVALALACRSPTRWWPSVLIGLAAALMREIALPFLLVMACAAMVERRRGEAFGWVAAIGAFALAMAAHAVAVHAVSTPQDLASPGWSGLGGWRFVLVVARDCSLLRAVPMPVAAILVPLALLGWAAWPGGYAARAALALGAWSCAFMAVGRPDNFYWGLLMAPILPIGLVLAIPALADLVRQLAPRSRAPQALAGAA